MEMARRKNTDCETCHNEMERPCRVYSHGMSFVKEKRAPERNPWREMLYTWYYLLEI